MVAIFKKMMVHNSSNIVCLKRNDIVYHFPLASCIVRRLRSSLCVTVYRDEIEPSIEITAPLRSNRPTPA